MSNITNKFDVDLYYLCCSVYLDIVTYDVMTHWHILS